jgi:hypothetical protein
MLIQREVHSNGMQDKMALHDHSKMSQVHIYSTKQSNKDSQPLHEWSGQPITKYVFCESTEANTVRGPLLRAMVRRAMGEAQSRGLRN